MVHHKTRFQMGPKKKVKPVMDDIEIESEDECDDFCEDDLDILSW